MKHDDPYRGGWTTSSYGAPKRRQHAVQIELNRALYVDEQTSEIKKNDFAQLQTVLDQLVGKLGETGDRLGSVRDGLIDHARFVRTNFEPVAAVRGLQVIGVQPILPAKLKHALHRSRDVFVKPVGKLDDDDGALCEAVARDVRRQLDPTCGLLCEGRLPPIEASIIECASKAHTEKSSLSAHPQVLRRWCKPCRCCAAKRLPRVAKRRTAAHARRDFLCVFRDWSFGTDSASDS